MNIKNLIYNLLYIQNFYKINYIRFFIVIRNKLIYLYFILLL